MTISPHLKVLSFTYSSRLPEATVYDDGEETRVTRRADDDDDGEDSSTIAREALLGEIQRQLDLLEERTQDQNSLLEDLRDGEEEEAANLVWVETEVDQGISGEDEEEASDASKVEHDVDSVEIPLPTYKFEPTPTPSKDPGDKEGESDAVLVKVVKKHKKKFPYRKNLDKKVFRYSIVPGKNSVEEKEEVKEKAKPILFLPTVAPIVTKPSSDRKEDENQDDDHYSYEHLDEEVASASTPAFQGPWALGTPRRTRRKKSYEEEEAAKRRGQKTFIDIVSQSKDDANSYDKARHHHHHGHHKYEVSPIVKHVAEIGQDIDRKYAYE